MKYLVCRYSRIRLLGCLLEQGRCRLPPLEGRVCGESCCNTFLGAEGKMWLGCCSRGTGTVEVNEDPTLTAFWHSL